MRPRELVVLFGIAAACIAVAFGLSAVSGHDRPRSALAAAPEGAAIVASLDVPAVLASPIWRALIAEDGTGLGHVEETCGFDPLARLRTVAIFVLGSEAVPLERVGFLARGDLPREQLIACVERVVGEDGGAIERVEIEGVPAIASVNGPSRAAFVRDDGIVGGDEAIVREVLRVDRGDAPGADGDEVLGRLWERVQQRREVVLVAHVPTNWREWLGRLGGEADLEAMNGVRALGLGAQIEHGLGITLAAETGSAAAASELVVALRDRIDGWRADPFLRASAAGTALGLVQLRTDGDTVVATVDLDEAQLTSLVDLTREIIRRRRVAAEVRARGEAPRERVQPDETVRPTAAPQP